MQDDRFQDYLDGVSWAKKRTTFSSCYWTSWPKTNLRVLTRLLKRLISQQKLFYMAETFHLMLKFNFLYNIMVNYMFLSYEYIFPRFKFADKVKTRTTCQLIIYKIIGSNMSFFHFFCCLFNHMSDITQAFWYMYMHHFTNIFWFLVCK